MPLNLWPIIFPFEGALCLKGCMVLAADPVLLEDLFCKTRQYPSVIIYPLDLPLDLSDLLDNPIEKSLAPDPCLRYVGF